MLFKRILTATAIALVLPFISASDSEPNNAISIASASENDGSIVDSASLSPVPNSSVILKERSIKVSLPRTLRTSPSSSLQKDSRSSRKRRTKNKKKKSAGLGPKTSCPFVARGRGTTTRPGPKRSHLISRALQRSGSVSDAPAHQGTCGDVLWRHNIYVSRDIYTVVVKPCIEYHPGVTEGCNALVQPFHAEVIAALERLDQLPSFQRLVQNIRHKVVIRGVVSHQTQAHPLSLFNPTDVVGETVPGDSYGTAHGQKCKMNTGNTDGFPVRGGSGAAVFISVGFSHCTMTSNTLQNGETRQQKRAIPPFIVLGHELVHAARISNGHGPDFGKGNLPSNMKNLFFNNEEYATVGGGRPLPFDGAQSQVGATENSLRHDANIALRSDYSSMESHCTIPASHRQCQYIARRNSV
ncbi:hypothetical protein HDU97_001091 [Phlyctochytrium planicorne]|nr:hypothetical protein HDU97_001091 [Phlyctochytrium planicorne]